MKIKNIQIRGVKLGNLYLGILDQMPLKRFWHNLVITGNAKGLFHINSHQRQDTGKLKVMYNTKETALKSAESMGNKQRNTESKSLQLTYKVNLSRINELNNDTSTPVFVDTVRVIVFSDIHNNIIGIKTY